MSIRDGCDNTLTMKIRSLNNYDNYNLEKFIYYIVFFEFQHFYSIQSAKYPCITLSSI